jgi:lysophospholipase L1-like esterase
MLHVDYSLYTSTWAQMDYAENYLAAHPDRVQLITLSVGGPQTNRFFQDCQLDPTCILNGLPAHTASLVADLTTILSRLRNAAYSGQIIFVEYPSTNYTGFLAQIVPQIYQAAVPVLTAYGAQKAPIFDAFSAAAAPFGGNSCAAGLLITNTNGTCNVHPTAAGHQLIASIISAMVLPH